MSVKLASVVLSLTLSCGFAPSAKAQAVQIAVCKEGGCTCHVPGTTLAETLPPSCNAPRSDADQAYPHALMNGDSEKIVVVVIPPAPLCDALPTHLERPLDARRSCFLRS